MKKISLSTAKIQKKKSVSKLLISPLFLSTEMYFIFKTNENIIRYYVLPQVDSMDATKLCSTAIKE